MPEIKVSIIIPVYNAASFIRDTIESVKNQTYTNWELILVDDCSSDESVSIIKEYLSDERIVLMQNENNLRAAKSRNNGILKATGDYLCFLDSDDIWMRDKLQIQLEFMREKDVAFSYTAYEFGDESAKGLGKYVQVLPKLSYEKALSRTIIFTSTVMFDLSKLSKEDIFMPDVFSEDTATWWKILKKGYKAYGIPKVLTIYRRPAKSLSSNKFEAIKRIWNLYRNVEKLNVLKSARCFVLWALRATLRRL